MYFKQLETWNESDWDVLFYRLPDLSINERIEVIQILTMPLKEGVKAGEKRLMELGVVNGLGPWWFPSPLRKFFTGLLPFLDFLFHDLGCLLARNKKDRLKADLGWRKYALKGINHKELEAIQQNRMSLMFYYKFTGIFKILTALTGYRLLRIFGSFSTNY